MKAPEKPLSVIEDARELINFWKPRDDRAKKCLELYHMYDKEERAKKADDQSYFISNEPRTLAETVISIISRKPAWPRIPIVGEVKEDRDIISKVERMCIGVRRMGDELMRKSWRGSSLASLTAKNAILTGWYGAAKLLIDDNGDIIIRMFDPIEFYPELGPDRPNRIIHRYTMSRSEAEREWGLSGYVPTDEKVKDVVVYDDWFFGEKRQVWNDVVIEDRYGGFKGVSKAKQDLFSHFVKEPVIVEGLERLPIIMGPVTGSTIRRNDVPGVEWQAALGQDIYSMTVALSEGGSNIYEQYNHLLSRVMELVDKAAGRSLIGKSPQGDLTADRIDNRPDGFTSLKTTESLEVSPYVTAPAELNRIASDIASQMQRGGVSWALTGQVPFEMSGYALDKLVAAALVTLNAFIQAQKDFFSDFWGLFLEQYRYRGQRPITFHGELRTGKLFEEEFSPQELTKKYYIEVDLEAGLPEDQATKAEIAARWKQVGIDTFTISDEILHMQDPDLLEERKLREIAMGIEPISLRRIENALRKAGDDEQADIVKAHRILVELGLKAELEKLKMAIQGQLGAGGRMRPSALPPEAAGTPEPTRPPVPVRPPPMPEEVIPETPLG